MSKQITEAEEQLEGKELFGTKTLSSKLITSFSQLSLLAHIFIRKLDFARDSSL